MQANSRRPPSVQAGFTLVEIMVGLAIGMLATVIIIQVISVFEAQRRTTTGTADAQTSGAIALYNIGRELQQAGYPLMPVINSPLECTALNVNGTADPTTPNRLSPVAVADNVAGTGVNASPSDRLTLRYGTGVMGGIPNQTLAALTAGDDVPVTLSNAFGCNAGDAALINTGASCTLTTVKDLPAPTATTITLAKAPTVAAGVDLSCLGTWNEISYAVNDGNLERTVVSNFGAASTTAVVAGVVNLQVQYGVSATANSNQVTRWLNAKNIADWSVPVDGAATPDNWGTGLTVANRNRIKSVRVAVVARNAKTEAGTVTAACSSITAAAPTGLCAWEGSAASPAPTIDLSAGDPNWRSYRYRVFETIIPLRNMVWSRETLL